MPVEIDAALVSQLLADQFPGWAHLPVRPVDVDGWDNRTFRLGEQMSVRLPSAEGYTAQVAKEHKWLPRLAPLLPLPIPLPLALGAPGRGYPWHWSVYRWLDGDIATRGVIEDKVDFASSLAGFLDALYHVDPAGGPPPGAHNFYRGARPGVYHAETRRAISALAGEIDAPAATKVWEAALASTWDRPPVWFHGDMAAGNLLVRDGQLAAVIDFGTSGVGDPACDLVIAWTFLEGESRHAFHSLLPFDKDTWARGRGWALWKALITLEEYRATDAARAGDARRVIEEVLADHRLAAT